MGPQPFGCGRPLPTGIMATDEGFNGAATFRLRKGKTAKSLIRCGMGFNGAATFRLRKGRSEAKQEAAARASMGPQPFGCGRLPLAPNRPSIRRFNGAATFRLRKALACACRAIPYDVLQWGRNLSVAEGLGGRPELAAVRGFNGAATFRLRKAGGAARASSRRSSFNGAATFRLRKATIAF